MPVDVRPARAEELGPVAAALRAAGLGANVGRLLEFPSVSPGSEVLAAVENGDVIGGAAMAGFGATGWIGALGVVGALRRRGIGTALTEAAVEWLREHGARTVLLYATESGRPVYQRLGFAAEGEAHAWRDVAPPPGGAPPAGIRPLAPGDRSAVRALDAAATGEDRAPVFDALGPLDAAAGLGLERDGHLAGSALRSPWGLGPSVVAVDTDAGLALLSALRRSRAGPLTVSLPDANGEALRALRAWGLRPINQATRMRLGPAPAYAPGRVFGMFNLFWG
ncbi:MAG TPA: GNAT family N-acetyltransferase [Solirubrobacteraceae bacterium]|jgi:GNAT superfamily N-acetyltransferase